MSWGWDKDWCPGPYPETQAEREAAAKKYGMRVEDYEPYTNDEGVVQFVLLLPVCVVVLV